MAMSELHENDVSTVTEDKLFVQRDDTGELLPQWEKAPQLGEVKVIPMTYGGIQKYFGAGTRMENIESADIAEIFRNHVVEPDLSEVTADEIDEDMKPMVPQALLLAVMKASGVDVDLEALEGKESVLEGN